VSGRVLRGLEEKEATLPRANMLGESSVVPARILRREDLETFDCSESLLCLDPREPIDVKDSEEF